MTKSCSLQRAKICFATNPWYNNDEWNKYSFWSNGLQFSWTTNKAYLSTFWILQHILSVKSSSIFKIDWVSTWKMHKTNPSNDFTLHYILGTSKIDIQLLNLYNMHIMYPKMCNEINIIVIFRWNNYDSIYLLYVQHIRSTIRWYN